jgi:hypothetical protein
MKELDDVYRFTVIEDRIIMVNKKRNFLND